MFRKDIQVKSQFKEHNSDYIKLFLETSLENLEVKTIITDGYSAYASIIDDLGFNHQRYTFTQPTSIAYFSVNQAREPSY